MSRTWILVGVLFLAAVVNDLILGVRLPGIMAAYGFVGCVVIIVASKWFGKAFAQRPEGYYTPQGGATRETGGLLDDDGGAP